MPGDLDRLNIRQSGVAKREGTGLDDIMRSITGQGQPEPEPQVVEVIPENAIIHREDGALVYKRFVMTQTGIEIPEDCSEPEWDDVGHVIKRLWSSVSWVVGDWALRGLNAGKLATQIAKDFGYEVSTIDSYASVCRSIHGLMRHQALSFDVHRPVMKLQPDQQQYFLDLAEHNHWNKAQLYEAINGKPTTPTATWKTWKKSGGRLEKVLKGSLQLTDEQFEDELQKFVEQARAIRAQRNQHRDERTREA